MNAIVLPPRTPADLEVDRLFQCMVNSTDSALQADYGRRFTEAVNRRNAARPPQEIERIERERGLRA